MKCNFVAESTICNFFSFWKSRYSFIFKKHLLLDQEPRVQSEQERLSKFWNCRPFSITVKAGEKGRQFQNLQVWLYYKSMQSHNHSTIEFSIFRFNWQKVKVAWKVWMSFCALMTSAKTAIESNENSLKITILKFQKTNENPQMTPIKRFPFDTKGIIFILQDAPEGFRMYSCGQKFKNHIISSTRRCLIPVLSFKIKEIVQVNYFQLKFLRIHHISHQFS